MFTKYELQEIEEALLLKIEQLKAKGYISTINNIKATTLKRVREYLNEGNYIK